MQREREEKIDLVESNSIIEDHRQASVDSSVSPADLPSFGDRYETIELIGQGGMGSVYKVKERQFGTFFAIKLLKPELAKDKTSVKRFEKEAEATSRLTHENLVAVYEHGCTGDGTPYIVMEFVGDHNLAHFIKERSHLGSADAIEIFKQICDALSYAHKAGVIHRDLKPSNIVVSQLSQTKTESSNGDDSTRNLIVKVTDFGIASVAIEGAPAGETLTQTGDIIGSPLYMSPEQCQGQSLDTRSDIYSFGCVMYTALTGHAPFEGANPVQIILKQIQETAPPFPTKLKTLANQELEKVILKCLEKDKGHRYGSVDDVKIDLLKVAAGKSIKFVPQQVRAAIRTRNYCFAMITMCVLALCIANNISNQNHTPVQIPTQVKAPAHADLTAEQALKHFKARQFDEAIPLLQYVAATAKREGNRQFEAFIYQCIGQSYLALKQYDNAEIWYKKSITLFGEVRHSSIEELQNDGSITEATTGYIEVLRALHKEDEAMRLLKMMNLEHVRNLEDFYKSFPPEDLKRVHDLRVELEKITKENSGPQP